MEKKTFKTKVKEFYKKHEVAIDNAGLVCSVVAIGAGAYLIGRGVGIEKVIRIPLGKYDLYRDGNKISEQVIVTVGDVLKKYYKENKMVKSMDFVDIKKLTNCKDA